MSQTTGKTSTYIKNTNVKESSQIQTGFKKTRFLHQAAAGDTIINTTSLTVPTGTANYSAPSVSELSRTNLQQWASNFQLISSVRGYMMQNVSYVITGATTIRLLDAALDGEIFEGIIDHNARTGVSLVDASPILASGTLAAGQTDFNVGTPFQVGLYPSQKHGIVLVYVDRTLMYRNTGNNLPGVGVEGDYYEVHSGAGLGQLIRFNTPDLINDREVTVVSLAGFVERPNGSFMAVMESLQGQIDAMVPTLAALAGEPETNYQGAPNNIDLKTFGDRVLTIESEQDVQDSRLDALELAPVAVRYTSTTAAAVPGTATVFNFQTLDYDNYSAVTVGASWRFTAPRTGFYRYAVKINVQNGGVATRHDIFTRIDSVVVADSFRTLTIASQVESHYVTGTVRLLAGQFLDFMQAETVDSSSTITGSYVTIDEVR